jgi:chromate reductase
MRILAISGSLRAASSNTAALKALALLAPAEIDVVLYNGLDQLPHFNPDLDNDRPPEPVIALREKVQTAQGLIICSPEYAHGVAGSMKNALDWLVGSLEFPGKPVALINTSPRATHAQAHLRETLKTMSAQLIDAACIDLPLLGRNLDAEGIAGDRELARQLGAALGRFAKAIGAAGRV